MFALDHWRTMLTILPILVEAMMKCLVEAGEELEGIYRSAGVNT